MHPLALSRPDGGDRLTDFGAERDALPFEQAYRVMTMVRLTA